MLRRPTERCRGKTVERRHAVADYPAAHCLHGDRQKPFAKVSFYLDLKDYLSLKKLTNDIKSLGGSVETFLSKDVKYVVTNRPNWKQHLRNGVLDDGSLPSTPTSLSNTKSGVTNDSPSNLESPKERNVPQLVISRASAMLEKARKSVTKGSSDVLQIARMWGVKVLPLATFNSIIKKSKSQHTIRRPNITKDASKLKLKSSTLETKLITPFVKFEDIRREYRPQYGQFREWPVLNLSPGHTRSPFAKVPFKKLCHKDYAIQQKLASSSFSSEENRGKKETCRPLKNAVREVAQPLNISMTTANKTIDVGGKPGFCEMCLIRYEDLYEHIKGKEHQEYLKEPGFYAMLDKKIAALPDIFTFATMVAKRLSSTSGSHSRSALAVSSESQNLKADFSMPMPRPVFRKRKHVDSCQASKKKSKMLTASSSSNAENCKPGSGRNARLPALEQFRGPPTKVSNSNPLKQLHPANVLKSKNSLIANQVCDVTGSSTFQRKALEPLDLNAIKPINFAPCQTRELQKCATDIPVHFSKKVDQDEKPEHIRVLRSTAMRRISACQTSIRAASSPSFRSTIPGDLLDSRKAKSSPSDSAAVKKKRCFVGVCRALDLGAPSPVTRRKSFLDAGQKLKNLAKECDASSDVQCLDSVLDAPNRNELVDVPFLECVPPISPLALEPVQRLVPGPPTLDSKSESHGVTDAFLMPDLTIFSKEPLKSECPGTKSNGAIGTIECLAASALRDGFQTLRGSSSSVEVWQSKDAPEDDDGVFQVEKNECSKRIGPVASYVQAAEASRVGRCDGPASAILGPDAPDSDVALDLSSRRDESKSSGNSRIHTAHISINTKLECNSGSGVDPSMQRSPSSVFNLISSPVFPQLSKALTNAAVVPRSEGSIPRFVFKRIRGDKRANWTVHVLSDDSGTA